MIYGLGVVMFVIGIASFFIVYGLLRGNAWARFSIMAFTSVGIGILVAASMFNIVEVANPDNQRQYLGVSVQTKRKIIF